MSEKFESAFPKYDAEKNLCSEFAEPGQSLTRALPWTLGLGLALFRVSVDIFTKWIN